MSRIICPWWKRPDNQDANYPDCKGKVHYKTVNGGVAHPLCKAHSEWMKNKNQHIGGPAKIEIVNHKNLPVIEFDEKRTTILNQDELFKNAEWSQIDAWVTRSIKAWLPKKYAVHIENKIYQHYGEIKITQSIHLNNKEIVKGFIDITKESIKRRVLVPLNATFEVQGNEKDYGRILKERERERENKKEINELIKNLSKVINNLTDAVQKGNISEKDYHIVIRSVEDATSELKGSCLFIDK